jgi:serine/threonine protein kinase
MTVTVKQFVKTLSDLGLMPTPDVAALKDRVDDEAADARPLAASLVNEGKLTRYQAASLYQGKHDLLVLGDYIVVDTIGKGGMGQVLKARHRRMKRTVAVKILPIHSMNNERAVARFYREVEIAGHLAHPNIVTAYDAGEANGIHYLVMEYVRGQDLSSLVRERGTISVDQAVKFILHAAKGLQYAHEQGVIHRDIKPGNLLLDTTGTVKILDVGLARLTGVDLLNRPADGDDQLTETSHVLGTADYLAPEQALDARSADARSDIYSLGCTMYRLLTGKPLYGGDTFMLKVRAHERDPIPSLLTERTDVTEQLNSVFQKMIAKLPEDRQQTMAAVVDDLQGCSRAISSPPPVPTASTQSTSETPPPVAPPLAEPQVGEVVPRAIPPKSQNAAANVQSHVTLAERNQSTTDVGEWYYKVMGEEVGPVSSLELQKLIRTGSVTDFSEVCPGLSGDWVSAATVKEKLGLNDETTAAFSESPTREAAPKQSQKPIKRTRKGTPPSVHRTGSKRSFLIRLLSGERGLAETFWLWNAAPRFIYYQSAEVLPQFLHILVLVYAIIFLAPLWLASERYTGPRIWGSLTRILCILNGLVLAMVVAGIVRTAFII